MGRNRGGDAIPAIKGASWDFETRWPAPEFRLSKVQSRPFFVIVPSAPDSFSLTSHF
jgi:hypothetical protein